jgi:hypothetical protein
MRVCEREMKERERAESLKAILRRHSLVNVLFTV